MIPIDAKLERDTDVYDETFSLDRVLLAIDPAKQLRLVIVDACRNNPFANHETTVASRSISRGLAKVEPEPEYADRLRRQGRLDGLGRQQQEQSRIPRPGQISATPGLDVRRAFGFVRDDVLQGTGNRQEPYVYGSLGGEDVALVPASTGGADGRPPIRKARCAATTSWRCRSATRTR